MLLDEIKFKAPLVVIHKAQMETTEEKQVEEGKVGVAGGEMRCQPAPHKPTDVFVNSVL